MNWIDQLPLVAYAGYLVLPLYACSIVALGIVLEKMWHFATTYKIERDDVDNLRRLIHGSDVETVTQQLSLVAEQNSIAGAVARACVSGQPQAELHSRMIRVAESVEARIGWLSSIASIAPMLGLLGTVTGMIRSFASIQEQGLGDPQILAGGINQALYTTALGLTVAVPVFLAHRWAESVFLSRTNLIQELLAVVAEREQGNTAGKVDG